ncbi:hypothetical protein OK016_15890 [Vibrio chagasii]|nr:hypothetical protein [Vibrio chagasii]
MLALKRLKADMTALLKSEIESLTEQKLRHLENANQQQAQQLSEATKRSQLLDEQIARVMHILRLRRTSGQPEEAWW